MNKKRKLILQTLDLDKSITSYQKAAIEAILHEKSPPLKPLLLKQREVATLLSLSRQAVYNLKKKGLIIPVRITGTDCLRYKRDDILKFIDNGITEEHL